MITQIMIDYSHRYLCLINFTSSSSGGHLVLTGSWNEAMFKIMADRGPWTMDHRTHMDYGTHYSCFKNWSLLNKEQSLKILYKNTIDTWRHMTHDVSSKSKIRYSWRFLFQAGVFFFCVDTLLQHYCFWYHLSITCPPRFIYLYLYLSNVGFLWRQSINVIL